MNYHFHNSYGRCDNHTLGAYNVPLKLKLPVIEKVAVHGGSPIKNLNQKKGIYFERLRFLISMSHFEVPKCLS